MSADAHRHGSLTEEAARLIEALESALFHGRAGAAPGRWVSDLISDLERDGGTGGAEECRYCPVCRAISAVRGIRPEAIEHLRDAGVSILAALRLAADGHGGQAEPAGPAAEADVIDLDAPAAAAANGSAPDPGMERGSEPEPGIQHIPIL